MNRLRYYRWLWNMRYFWFLRAKRNELPLRIYEAAPGGGKTLSGCRDIIKAMRGGVRCASNLYIRDAYTGQEAIECRTWVDMLRLTVEAIRDGEPILFFFDELQNICDARSWQNTPDWWRYVMSQHRHFGIGLIGTTQSMSGIEKRLRILVTELLRVRRVQVRGWFGILVGRLISCVALGFVAWGVTEGEWAYVAPGVIVALLCWRVVPVLADRLAFFREIALDASMIDTPGAQWETAGQRTVWMPWYAWHSYSTSSVIQGEDLSVYKDEDMQAEIAALTAEMAGLLEIVGLPAWQDELDRLRDERLGLRDAA